MATSLRMVSSSLHFHKLPLSSGFPLASAVEALAWAYGAGTGASPGLGSLSAFADDQDEDEEFQQPQPFNDEALELDDLDGTHAVMVRAKGLAGVCLVGGRALESSWMTPDKSFPSLSLSFPICNKTSLKFGWASRVVRDTVVLRQG